MLENQSPYVTWGSKNSSKSKTLSSLTDNVEGYGSISRATHGGRESLIDFRSNLSIRSEYNIADYRSRRPNERVPQEIEDILRLSMEAYEKVGIVRNMIDLMADFASQGIRLVHPDNRIQRFYQRWFRLVEGPRVSERFLNYLYRVANVVVKRLDSNGKISVEDENEFKRVHGQEALEQLQQEERIIPVRYNFLNPLSVEIVEDELSAFTGKPRLEFKLSSEFRNTIRKLDKRRNQSLALPPEFRKAMRRGAHSVPLDPKKVSLFHYKKDDWKKWAIPLTFAVMDDLMMLQKMKLADLSALDGAISSIRLWRLGDIENEILPSRASLDRLRDILAEGVGGGTLDLVWGPELDFKESETSIHNFLGPNKYEPVLTNIYAGLGVPPTLTGAQTASGFTNNFISLKTLINRLEYGRDILLMFWNQEIRRVQKAMGFRAPAKVVFDNMILSDEAAEKKLLIDLADRNIISEESLRDKLDIPHDIEKLRVNREVRDRNKGRRPTKASPFHNPQTEFELKKIILQKGGVAPSQLGIELQPATDGDSSPNEQMMKLQQKFSNPEGGRPPGRKDSQKRKQKQVQPRTSASDFVNLFIWANHAQKSIADIVEPAVLGSLGKKNMRKLSKDEFKNLEYIKFNVLCNTTPYEEITAEKVYKILREESSIPQSIASNYKLLSVRFVDDNDRSPNLEERQQIQSSAYALQFSEDEE